MNDKQFRNFALLIGGAGLLWWLSKRKSTSSNTIVTPDPHALSPEETMYVANPQQFLPPSASDLNVNIANQGLGYLDNKYIPLFGFVGMAQGVTFQ